MQLRCAADQDCHPPLPTTWPRVEALRQIVRGAGDAQAGADALIAAVLAAGAHDNVTAVVVRLADLTPAPAGGRS